MNPLVRFEDEADAEYREAGRWYAKNPRLGLEFFDEIDATVRRILEFPRAGVPVPRVPRDLPIRRLAVKRFPYHVIYLAPTNVLWILAISHERRKPGYWKYRLKKRGGGVGSSAQRQISAAAATTPLARRRRLQIFVRPTDLLVPMDAIARPMPFDDPRRGCVSRQRC